MNALSFSLDLGRVVLSILGCSISLIAAAQQWALGPQVGSQRIVAQYDFPLALRTLGATNFNAGILATVFTERRLISRPYSLSFGAIVATRRMRSLVNDVPPVDGSAMNRGIQTAYTPELTAALNLNLANFRPGAQGRGRFGFDLGMGIAIGRLTDATICYRVDGEPCTRETANVYTTDNGGSPVDPFILGDLYWDSDVRFQSVRLRIGYGGYWHVAQVSRYLVSVNYSDFSGSENASVDRTSGRLYVLYYL